MDSKPDIALPPEIAAIIHSYPPHIQNHLFPLRDLILETAKANSVIGPIEEALKWGEPSFLTRKSKSGSTIRIAWSPKRPDEYGLFFNCKTKLVDSFRTLFPDTFTYAGNRAIIFKANQSINDECVDKDALALCISKALTYHLDK